MNIHIIMQLSNFSNTSNEESDHQSLHIASTQERIFRKLDLYKAKRPTIPTTPARPAPITAVGRDAPPDEDEEPAAVEEAAAPLVFLPV